MNTIQCPQCQKDVQVPQEGYYSCPHCQVSFEYLEKVSSPWESRWNMQPIGAYFETLMRVALHPVTFFKKHLVSQAFWAVLFFSFIGQLVGMLSLFIFQTLFHLAVPAIFAGSVDALSGFVITPMVMGVGALAGLLSAFAGVFLQVVFYHLFLLIVGGARNGFKSTFDVVCFSNGLQVVSIVPFVGQLAAWIWQLVVVVIGFKEVHQISYAKSILAVILPLVLCVCLFMTGFSSLMALMASSGF